MQSTSLKKMVTTAFMSAIAFVIMYLAFPLPLMPGFLKIDLSDIPALIGAIIYGPLVGILIELIKNILHFFIAGAGVPIGELANFFAGSLLILISTSIYRKKKTFSSLLLGLALGTVVMSVLMSIANYYFILPAYAMFMGFSIEQAVSFGHAANPSVQSLFTLIVLAILPFNLIKGIIVSLILIPLWLRLRPRFRTSF